MADVEGYPGGKAVVPNIFSPPTEATVAQRYDLRRTALKGFSGPLVVFHSRLSWVKGVDVLVRALALLRRRETHLAVIGPDDEDLEPGLMNLASELGVKARVTFVGPLYGSDLHDALASADVWALPSYSENFGYSVLDALHAGLPCVVSTAVNLAPDIAAAGVGMVREPKPEEFAKAIDLLLQSERTRTEMSSGAQEFVRRYSPTNVTRELKAMYQTATLAKQQAWRSWQGRVGASERRDCGRFRAGPSRVRAA